MKCCWKTVVLLLVIALTSLYFILGAFDRQMNNRVVSSIRMRPSDSTNTTSQKMHILILATMRSGSSFLGQLLNHHKDVFYLFEPVYHVEKTISTTRDDIPVDKLWMGPSRDLLRSLFSCNMYALEDYIHPVPKQHMTTFLFRRGSSRALCSPPVCKLTTPSKVDMEEIECNKKCKDLNITLAAESCRAHRLVVIKTVRVPNIKELRDLLEDPRLNLRIIHLVRDPRGILASWIHTFNYNKDLLDVWKKTGKRPKDMDMSKVIKMCKNFFESYSIGMNPPSWLKGKYLLVRYEDMALNPVRKALDIYDNLGVSVNNDVLKWLTNTIQGGKKSLVRKPFGTLRNSKAEAEDWRLELPFEVVKYTQSLCRNTLEHLGYKIVNSEKELKNMHESLVI